MPPKRRASSRQAPTKRLKQLTTAKRQERQDKITTPDTIISTSNLSLSLAFLAGWADVTSVKTFKMYSSMMTGNWITLTTRVASQDYTDISLLVATLAMFSLGFAIFRFVDNYLQQGVAKGKACSWFAFLVFGLMYAADYLILKDSTSRWPIVFVAMASGIINAVSSSRCHLVTNMMTGHVMTISSNVADYAFERKMLNANAPPLKLKQNTYVSIKIIGSFCSGAAMKIWLSSVLVNKAAAAWKFGQVGTMYMLLLVLSETTNMSSTLCSCTVLLSAVSLIGSCSM